MSWGRLGVALGRLGNVLGSKTVHDRSKIAPRWPQDFLLSAPRLPKIVTRSPKTAQRRPKSASRGRQQCRSGGEVSFSSDFMECAKSVCFSILLGLPVSLAGLLVASGGVLGASRADVASLGGVFVSPWGVLGASWGPRRSETVPRPAQDNNKTACRRPEDWSRSPQHGQDRVKRAT